MKIKIRNYRNIPISKPLEFSIDDGITFLLGANNAGKSNIITFFHDFREMFRTSDRIFLKGYDNIDIKLKNKFFDRTVHQNGNEEEISCEIHEESGHVIEYVIRPRHGSHSHEVSVGIRFVNGESSDPDAIAMINKISDLFLNTLIIGTYRTPLNNLTGESLDLQIGNSFIENWSDWADSGEVQKTKKIDLLMDELRTLFNYRRFEIRIDKERQFIVTTDDGTFYLKELGTGIGQFILILSKALVTRPSYIFIDEPEISLHPKMQEIFIRALAAKSRHGLFATSHSIGLARSVADKIYTLSRDDANAPFISEYGKDYHPTISQVINEMSYSQFVEIGQTHILIVEGRTDVKSYKEILKKYDIDGSFIVIPFGGSQFMTNDRNRIFIELKELQRLNAKSISVIFDSEKTSPTTELNERFAVFKKTCEELGFIVFPTDRHSTENYITQEAITKILGSEYTALMPFENFKNHPKKWQKEKNWLMFIEMTREDFKGTELDEFITKHLIPRAHQL